jgi:DNA-binding NtrC family response regulator
MVKAPPRILVLDDEKLIRWSLGQILTQEGFGVDAVATAEEALKLAAIHRYEVILADLDVCGDGAEGFFKAMLAGRPETELIILTAVPGDKAGERLGGCRTFRIIEKPFASEDIKAATLEALRSHRFPLDSTKEV